VLKNLEASLEAKKGNMGEWRCGSCY